MARFEIGTVSEGTLRTEDLLPAFADALQGVTEWGAHNGLIAAARAISPESEEAGLMVQGLEYALSECCPPFVYFGSLAGDGADFGFWPDHDEIQEAQRFGTVYEADREYIYSDDHGVWIHVNDHGNVTVLTDDDGKPGNEIWSAV